MNYDTAQRLSDILGHLTALRLRAEPSVAHLLVRAEDAIEDALANLRGVRHAGVHRTFRRNPQLVIFNPPRHLRHYAANIAGCIGKLVHSIRYVHAEDGQAYEHPFETPVQMHALVGQGERKDILIKSPGGLELWRDF